jgi:hypothetical protein
LPLALYPSEHKLIATAIHTVQEETRNVKMEAIAAVPL